MAVQSRAPVRASALWTPSWTRTRIASDAGGRAHHVRANEYAPKPHKQQTVTCPIESGMARHGYPRDMPTKEEVYEQLREVEDPELGMDVVELGLVYDVEVEGPKVRVVHSLTSMGCPAGPMIQEGLDEAARRVPGVEDVEIELTWDPPWTPELMSEDAKFILGFG
jgi:metal-sulfur cluster biosynthetic enzyme